MATILVNAFSLNMIPSRLHEGDLFFRRLSDDDMVTRFLDFQEGNGEIRNAIGHRETDAVVRAKLQEFGYFVLPGERSNVEFTENDVLLVAQYRGPRLPEGATELPEGATIEFMSVGYL